MKKTVTYYAKRMLSLLMAICVLLLPTAAFGEPPAPTPINGTLVINSHQSDNGTAESSNGRLFIKQGDAESFTEVDFNSSSGEFETAVMDAVTSLTVKIEPNENYEVDSVRGVTLRVNGQEFKITDEGSLSSIISADGYKFDFSSELGESTAQDVPLSLEFSFGENTTPPPASDNGKLRINCQNNAFNGGKVEYKFNDSDEFAEVGTYTNQEDQSQHYNSVDLTDKTSIIVKFTPNEGYKLDEGRGVSLNKNPGDPQTVSGANFDTYKSVVDGVTSYTMTFTLSDVASSRFELEFGFEASAVTPPPANENGKLSFGGIDASRGSIEYKFTEEGDFTAVGTTTDPETSEQRYNPIDLDNNSSIILKFSPAVGYKVDTVRGIILRKNGNIEQEVKETDLKNKMSENNDGTVYFTLTFALSEVDLSQFELDFGYEEDQFTDGGHRPHGDEYTGTIKESKLTITGAVNVCINDSILINEDNAASREIPIQYHYNGGNKVDFYIQCRITERYTAITINGTNYYPELPTPNTPEGRQALLDACKGQLNEFKLSVPYNKDGYTVSAAIKELDESDKDYMQVGNFLWRYIGTSETEPDDLIENGKMELIKVEHGGTTYTKEDLTNEASGFHWNDAEIGGEAVLPAGATVTVKIIPKAGFQLTSFGVNGSNFGTGVEQSVFTFTVEQGNFHLGAHISDVEDKVVANSEAVAGGEITLGAGEIDTGSVQLTVEDNTDEGLRNEFESVELDSGFAVQSVLDINLQQVLYKGREDDFWANEMSSLSQAAKISFDLADAFGNVVVLHKKSDGEIEKIIPTYENGRITFETSSFSPFALAVVESTDPKYQIGFDPRGEEGCVTVKIGSGTATTAVPWANRTYTSGDSTFTITINVPEDRKEFKPLVSVERMVGDGEPMDAFEPTLSGRNGVYSFSFVPNRKFSVSNAEFVVIINWCEYDAIWVGDDQYCIKTVNVNPELGDIEILTAGIKSVSLGDETKTVYDRQDTTYTVDVKFTPKPGRVRLSRLFVGETELSADGGQITPLGADGSFTYTVTIPVNGAEVDSNLDIAAEFDENVAVSSITVQTSPAVTTYSIDEDIDVAGGQIKVTYENGWSEVIDMEPEMISTFDSSDSGTKNVTVSFEGKTTTFTVEVVETERVGLPVISPDGGTFTGSKTVTITCPTEDAKIFYSKDGIEYAEYTAPFTISASTTVSAYATKDDLLDSFTATAEFTKKSSSSGGNTGGGSSSGGYVPSTPTEPTGTTEPEIVGENGVKGWDVITEEIKDAEIGDIVSVQMNGAKVLPKNILDEIKGKNITLVLNMGDGFIWTINGESVTDAASIDMGVSLGSSIPVSVINALTGEKEYITIKLNHSGNFGFTAVLTVNMGAKNNGYYANLYYFNELKREAEFMDSGKIRLNGRVKLTFTHASEYIIVIDAADHGSAGGTGDDTSKPDTSDTDNSNSGTGSNGNSGTGSDTSSGNNSGSGATNPPTGIVMGYGILFVSGAGLIIARKKRNKN